MGSSIKVAALFLTLSAGPVQDARDAYVRAVAEFFDVPRNEVAILGDWDLPTEEIPVVLFVARRAGVSPEALASLRGTGRGWGDLARRYQLDGAQFHVPLPDDAPAGVLSSAYRRYRSTPVSGWGEIELSDTEIIRLVNVRLLAEQLRLPPATILAEYDGSFVELYGRLIRDG